MNFLITGGAGFIGSHLAERLLADGHRVTALDNFSGGDQKNITGLLDNNNFRCVEGDILDSEALEELIARAEGIFHLAAIVGVKQVAEKPLAMMRTNLSGSERVFRIASQYGRKVVFTSSSEVYGKALNTQSGGRLHEAGDLLIGSTDKRRWGYASSKLAAEHLAVAFYETEALPVVITRLFNTVGPRQSGKYGMVIPKFVERALKNEPLPVFGDGSSLRSFTHVSDTVAGLIQLMECKQANGQVYNLGNYGEISIGDLAGQIIEMTGSSSTVEYGAEEDAKDSREEEDPRRRVPDLTRITEAVGYYPRYTLGDIISEIVSYYTSAGYDASKF